MTDPREPCPSQEALGLSEDFPEATPSRGRAVDQKMGACVRIHIFGLLICKMGPRKEVTHSVNGALAVCTVLLAGELAVKKTGLSL